MIRFQYKVLAGAVALLMIAATTAPQAAASTNSDFRRAVSRVLNSIKGSNEFLGGLSSSEFSAFVSCAQGVMDGATRPRKEYVLAAGSLGEQQRRFNEISLENRAALKQAVALKCQP